MLTDEERREADRARVEAYRDRVRYRRVLVSVEVTQRQLAALERLALLDKGARDKAAIGQAVLRFLDGADGVARLGDALWPATEAGHTID